MQDTQQCHQVGHPSVNVRIVDNDGEFLLIESAEYLPKELTPETSSGRVYIQNGDLHIIPVQFEVPDMKSALDVIVHNKNNTFAASNIQEASFRRCTTLLEGAQQVHRQNLEIPHLAAHILHKCPQLISPIIDAFYNRDAQRMKKCTSLDHFDPTTNVSITVSFTRTRYSQLKMSKFIPWKTSQSITPKAELGMKLACAFEIFYNSINQTKEDVDLDDEKFQQFKKCLTEQGYYGAINQGSHEDLDQQARLFFIGISQSGNNDEFQNTSLQNQFLLLMTSTKLCDETELPRSPSDSDSWMMMNPEDVDKLLESEKVNVEFSDSDSSVDMVSAT